MICWKCDGDHLAANCPRWPGFEYPPERTPPHLRQRLDQTMARDAQMRAMERIQTGAEPPPEATNRPATLLAPPGACPFCDARRAAGAANEGVSTASVSARKGSEGRKTANNPGISVPSANAKAARRAYQRELMRKRRAKAKEQGEAQP